MGLKKRGFYEQQPFKPPPPKKEDLAIIMRKIDTGKLAVKLI